MSNQIGDRYSCSDPNCGCEIEIERPCGLLAGSGDRAADSAEGASSATVSTGSRNSMSQKARDFRSEGAVSTPGDFGAQGATGEGNFGTAGGGRSATTSGRYDTESTRVVETGSDRRASENLRQTITCFCGKQMRPIASAQQRANAARI